MKWAYATLKTKFPTLSNAIIDCWSCKLKLPVYGHNENHFWGTRTPMNLFRTGHNTQAVNESLINQSIKASLLALYKIFAQSLTSL